MDPACDWTVIGRPFICKSHADYNKENRVSVSWLVHSIGNAVGIDAPLRLAHHNLHLFLSCPTARGIGKCGRDGSRYHVLLKTRPRNCECLVWRTLVFSLEMESLDDSKWKDVASTVPPTSNGRFLWILEVVDDWWYKENWNWGHLWFLAQCAFGNHMDHHVLNSFSLKFGRQKDRRLVSRASKL